MSNILAVLVYLVALVIPLYMLMRFQAQARYWHVLAVGAALALGLIPEPIGLPTAALDLVFGFAFVSLTIWGIGGLLRIRPHHEKHA